jgi:SAM-dependent methyltransferase
MTFADHFSRLAADYARFRPHYPPELYLHLAGAAPAHDLAWDCGTGSGQAAVQLAEHFRHVHATDASAEQIAHAQPHPCVSYHVEPAESVSLEDASTDLVTVALAVHWFDFAPFYQEVHRVLRPGGVIAVWGYHLPSISAPVDRVLFEYYSVILGGYWPERIRYLDDRYRSLPFPFQEVDFPRLEMRAGWTLDHLAGFLSSWSAAQRYLDANGQHPLEVIWERLEKAWGDRHQELEVRWPLFVRLGKKVIS